MSYTMTLDMPERTTEFVRRREARLRPALHSIVVAFITTQMRYEDSLDRDDAVNAADADRESRQDEVGVIMAEFDKLATLTSARRDSPYVFNRADAYAETLA